MREAACVATLPEFRPIPCSLVPCPTCCCRCCPMTWRTHPREVSGDDVAHTSLNAGRGEVLVLMPVACMKRHQWMDGTVPCGGSPRRPNAEAWFEMRHRAKCG